MKVVTVAVALILYLTIIANGAMKGNYLFLKQSKNLNCHKIQRKDLKSPTVGSGATFCTLSCIQSQTESCTCAGWKKENGGCEMCYECSGGGSTTTFDAPYTPYVEVYDPRPEADLYQSFDDASTGLPNINLGLRFIDGSATTVTGKKNNAIGLVGYNDVYHLSSVPTTLCRNSLTACNNGVTFAFWLRISNNTGWSSMTQPVLFLRTNCLNLAFFNGILIVELANRATGIWKQQNITMRFNEWVHYAVTWDNPTNVMSVYENGVLFGTGADIKRGTYVRNYYFFRGYSLYPFAVDEYYTFEKIMDAKTVALLANE